MRNLSFHLHILWANIETQAIYQDLWSFHLYLSQCHLLHNLTCSLCKKSYIGETERRPGDPFWEHLREVEKDDKKASKPVAKYLNLPNHCKHHMTVYGLSLHQGSTESRKTLVWKFIHFKLALLILKASTNAFPSTNLLSCLSRYQAPANSVAPGFQFMNHTQPTIPRFAPTKG